MGISLHSSPITWVRASLTWGSINQASCILTNASLPMRSTIPMFIFILQSILNLWETIGRQFGCWKRE